MSNRVTDIDMGWGLEKARLLSLGDLGLEVGFFEGDRYPDGTSVAGVAALLEWGTQEIEPQAFLRGTLDAFREKYARQAESLGRRVLAGTLTQARAMELLSEMVREDVRAAILSAGLVDTGRLVDSIEVREVA